MRIFFFLNLIFLLFCNLKTEDKKKKEKLLNNYLLQQIQNSSTCNFMISEQPTFVELHQKKIFTNCIKCHSGTEPKANFDIENYDQTKIRTVPYHPEESKLYLVLINGGIMEEYSNFCINNAVYQWIKNGSKEK